jgi:hypothetical protein
MVCLSSCHRLTSCAFSSLSLIATGPRLPSTCNKISRKTLTLVLDTQRLSVGEVWSREIEQAIDRADVILALLSAEVV